MRSQWCCLALLALSAISLTWLVGCGSGGSKSVAPAAPAFNSAPVTAAVEGNSYSYTLAATDPDGGAVSFALTAAPQGATLSGNTITWTPTSAQSRVTNSFAVTATTSKGGTAKQSWTVSPNGTVRVTEAITYWGPSGATTLQVSWSASTPAAAVLIPQADGTFEAIYGMGDSNGVLSFQNVPAGYFWLSLNATSNYWTSSSTIDLGQDRIGAPLSVISSTGPKTTFEVDLSGLDALTSSSEVRFLTVPTALSFTEEVVNSTTLSWTDSGAFAFSSTALTNLDLDFSKIHDAFAMQYETAQLGGELGHVLGPELTFSGLTLTNGVANIISGTLAPSPQASLPLKINGADWATLFDNTAPTAPTPVSSPFSLQVEPFITGINAQDRSRGGLQLFSPDSVLSSLGGSLHIPSISSGDCQSGLSTTQLQTCTGLLGCLPNSVAAPPLISGNVDFGTVAYGDPFPATWQRTFNFCQQAVATISNLDSNTTLNYSLSNRQSIALPSAPVTPLVSPVVNPTINGASLFTAATLNSRVLTLSWEKPSIGSPYGYNVQVLPMPTSLTLTPILGPGTISSSLLTSISLPVAVLNTAQTSVAIPPEFLTAGKTYLFTITALVDGKANMETSPNRSALPTASANVVSAPIAISASAP